MRNLLRSLPSLTKQVFAVGLIVLGSGQALGSGEGHGGGAGHVSAAGYGGRGYGGYGGRGYGGYGRYGYGGWGFGYGFGLGLGVGYYGGYPYYGYGGYPYDYGYPYPYGYPGYAASPPIVPPVGPVASASTASPVSGNGIVIPIVKSPDTDVALIVHTPADAVVWVNGVKTTQTGPRREFVSSGLTPGLSYTFDIRAQWVAQDGRSMDIHRRVPAQAGERRAIDFLQPNPPQGDVTTVQVGASSK